MLKEFFIELELVLKCEYIFIFVKSYLNVLF